MSTIDRVTQILVCFAFLLSVTVFIFAMKKRNQGMIYNRKQMTAIWSQEAVHYGQIMNIATIIGLAAIAYLFIS